MFSHAIGICEILELNMMSEVLQFLAEFFNEVFIMSYAIKYNQGSVDVLQFLTVKNYGCKIENYMPNVILAAFSVELMGYLSSEVVG